MTRVLVWGTVTIILLGAAGLAVTASQAPNAPPQLAVAARDPDLARCRDLGEAGGADEACRAAWAAARARFFDGGRP
jgi:conjugative transfer region protein TrbK